MWFGMVQSQVRESANLAGRPAFRFGLSFCSSRVDGFATFGWTSLPSCTADFVEITLNCEEFRVTMLESFLAVITVPFLFSTINGSGLYGALNLFSFGCFRRTVSPGLMLLSLAPRMLSAQHFICSFFQASYSAIAFCSGFEVGYISGSIVFIFLLLRLSEGDVLVVEWRVAL